MTTYAELKAQADALMAQAEQIRRSEKARVISEIRAKMVEYGISPEELSGARSASSVKRAKAEAKYRGPNGELWSGGPGRKPQWVRDVLAAGGNLDQYRI